MDNTQNKPPPKPPDKAVSEENNKPKTSAAPAGSKAAVGYLNNQNETSAYEEYLFGQGTYIKGTNLKAWNDTTQGRTGVRLISRGLFGAAAFAWGGRVSGKLLQNYHPNEFNPEKANALQWLAKGFDTVLGKPIAFAAKSLAPKGRKEMWASEAVTFRHKAYYHDQPGKTAGRSLGAEMVAMTFDFASASVGDATARNIIQSFDPALRKPWQDDKGNFSVSEMAKHVGNATWRVFSKNQMEDWGAALPYVYQMKFQRQAISNHFPGFKLTSDRAWNGGAFKMNSAGKVVGDYQLPGLIDLQFRFAGYNWYTLMYRETYDAIAGGFKKWKQHNYEIKMPHSDDPVHDVASAIVHPFRYIAKSFVKSQIYMIPAVPFFWMWRTPQTKWRSSAVMLGDGSQNAYASRVPQTAEDLHAYSDLATKELRYASPTVRFSTDLKDSTKFGIDPGGIHTNPFYKQGDDLFFGTRRVPNASGLGRGDAPFKWSNQKTLTAKLLNPFGWISYKVGSAGVHLMDHLDPTGNRFKVLFSNDLLQRELRFRSFSDASLAYTPYFIAKSELALRVDDRGPEGSLGKMDKALYGAIDNIATFNVKGLGDSVHQIGNLLRNRPEEVSAREGAYNGKIVTDEQLAAQARILKEKHKKDAQKKEVHSKEDVKPAASTSPEAAGVPDTKILSKTSQLGVEARRNFVTEKASNKKEGWSDEITKERANQQPSMLYAPHRTVQ